MVPKEGGEDFSPVEITYNVTCKMNYNDATRPEHIPRIKKTSHVE